MFVWYRFVLVAILFGCFSCGSENPGTMDSQRPRGGEKTTIDALPNLNASVGENSSTPDEELLFDESDFASAMPTHNCSSNDGPLACPEQLKSRIGFIEKNKGIPRGTVATLWAYYHDALRMEKSDSRYYQRAIAKLIHFLDRIEQGEDPIATARGLFWRGYKSQYSYFRQFYSTYVPADYDETKPIPLIVTLHGGSSNHNVWAAMMLGHNIDTKDYRPNFRTEYKARRHPNAIVVAPDGLGQIRWRWMAEKAVQDVIKDVRENYNIDENKIFLTGLSNGGIGSYVVGLKNAWQFAAVVPLAGVTHWPSHLQGKAGMRPSERQVLENESAITYAENAFNTNLQFYHGVRDPGFKVTQARRMASVLKKMEIPHVYRELGHLGHDLSHVLWRDLSIMKIVQAHTRKQKPKEVRLVTAQERFNRQHWVVLEDRRDHRIPGRIRAVVEDNGVIQVETENVKWFRLLLNEAPVGPKFSVRISDKGNGASKEVYSGSVPSDGFLSIEWRGETEGWVRWQKPTALTVGNSHRVSKGPRLSGPLGDANFVPQVHVYGTQVAEDIPSLKRAAELGARAWILGSDYSDVRQPVIPDTEFKEEMLQDRVLVLYGNGGNNTILKKIGDRLPIKVGNGTIQLRNEILDDTSVGARFVCPNPLAPTKYLVVKAGNSAEAVLLGARQLPLYLPDYIVHDRVTTQKRAFMNLGKRKEIEVGFFTEDWELPPLDAESLLESKKE